eukprot:TRINITY_DN1582_c3_g1_i1.p1 TRINITY_DN1582_c3_g1~~TRINITY_DN1582_c3_g1_i1.p1  ORF type:complete len:206 (+),score=38.78 TRINITY_DN1582_c3_g1_i1:77-619(+)
MNSVPKELWRSVLSFVEPSAFGNVRGVCKGLNNMSPDMNEVGIEVIMWTATAGRRGKSVMLKKETSFIRTSNYASFVNVRNMVSGCDNHEALFVDPEGKIVTVDPTLPLWSAPTIKSLLLIPENTIIVKKDTYEPYVIKPTTLVSNLASRSYVTYLSTTNNVCLSTDDKVSGHKILFGSY